MEKMNQVSVSEFFAKTNEERYDDAVAMVEKYNRLVDICNDSAERIAELVERHKVYTSALNKDLVDKDAKIELLEKEIEGRKEGYYALKEKMDNLKDEVARLNKCIMNKNESINTANDAIVNLRKEIGAHEEENKKLENRISELKTEVNKLNRFLKMQEDLTRDWKNKYVEAQKEIDEWESDSSEYETIIQYQELIDGLNKDLSYWKEAFETQATSLADVRKCNDDLVDTLDKSNDRIEELEKQVKNFESETIELSRIITKYKKENGDYAVRVGNLKKELEQTCTTKELDLKGHQRREMSLVNALADKNDEIKKLKESIEEWKNQERIRTDQLRATERKVEELWKEIEKFTKGEDDDHGKSGFKRYIEYLIEEEERKSKEVIEEAVNERLNEEITKIFKKEEETEVKGVGRTNSGRYPWGAKVNDIPCGEDAIE